MSYDPVFRREAHLDLAPILLGLKGENAEGFEREKKPEARRVAGSTAGPAGAMLPDSRRRTRCLPAAAQ